MNLKSFFESKIKKMDWFDLGLIKWCCIFFGILIAKIIPQLKNINTWWLVFIVIVLAIRPFYKTYLKN